MEKQLFQMEKIKRKRSENWTVSDKNLLRELCADSIKIIENKSVDTNTNRQKKECWTKITDAFNSISDAKREVSSVQFQWKNMKMKAKSAESSYRKSRNQTGGGPPPVSPSKEDKQLIELIPNEFKVDCNNFDSDGVALQDTATSLEPEQNAYANFECLEEYEIYEDSNKENDKSELKRKEAKKKSKEKKLVSDSDYSERKELFELTKAQMDEEHKYKLDILTIEKKCKLKELHCREKELEKIELEIELLKRQF